MPGDGAFRDNVDSLLAAYRSDLASDPLLSCLSDVATLRPFLDVVLENLMTTTLSVCELQASRSSMYHSIAQQLASHPKLRMKLTLADNKQPQGESIDGVTLTAKEWDLSREASELGQFHLVVLNNVLHHQSGSALQAVKKAAELMADGGFLLVQEVTHNFPVYLAMEGLHRHLPLQQSENGTVYGWYKTEASWQELFSNAGLQVVMQASDQYLSSMFLLRRPMSEVPVAKIY